MDSQEQKSRGLVVLAALALTLVVALAAWWTYRSPEVLEAYAGPPRFRAAPSIAHSSLRKTPPPWPALAPGLRERLELALVPYGKDETTAFHTHQHLAVFVDGRKVQLPEGIGIDSQAGVIGALHTHDKSGVIHVEAPAATRFTLGQFFDAWGVHLDKDCLGSLCGDLKVFANGKQIRGDPRGLVLEQHQQVVVAHGELDLPEPFDFSDFS